VIDEALERGEERPLTTADLEQALAGMRPSTLEWIATARNYVEFANQGAITTRWLHSSSRARRGT
jgi:transitional endoplasmic reticulum ATPase